MTKPSFIISGYSPAAIDATTYVFHSSRHSAPATTFGPASRNCLAAKNHVVIVYPIDNSRRSRVDLNQLACKYRHMQTTNVSNFFAIVKRIRNRFSTFFTSNNNSRSYQNSSVFFLFCSPSQISPLSNKPHF